MALNTPLQFRGTHQAKAVVKPPAVSAKKSRYPEAPQHPLHKLHQTLLDTLQNRAQNLQDIQPQLQHLYLNALQEHLSSPQHSPLLQRLKWALAKAASADTAFDPKAYQERVHPIDSHCKAVAFVIKTLMGGSILKGKVCGQVHYFNQVGNGQIIDCSSEQYGKKKPGDELPRPYNGFTPQTDKTTVDQSQSINPRFKRYLVRVLALLAQPAKSNGDI